MPNVIVGKYNPVFYAQEAVALLKKALGMAARVYRGYDYERKTYKLGNTVNITVPGTFTAQTAGSGSQAVNTMSLDIALTNHKEVQFDIPDKDLAASGDKIIQDHISPAVYALADDVDQALMGLAHQCPWKVAANSTIDHTDILNPRKVLRDNKVVLDDGLVHLAVDASIEAKLLGLDVFKSAGVAGAAGQETLLRGSLGARFGVEVFASQNAGPVHTSGTVVNGGDQAGALVGAHAMGADSVTIDGLTDAQTVKAGDSFVIAGHTQRYVILEDKTVASNAITAKVWPKLVTGYADNAVVTFENGGSGTGNLDKYAAQFMFHRNAIALVVPPLPEIGDGLGAKLATVIDPDTGIAIRATIWYNPASGGSVCVKYDILYGYALVDPNKAAVLCVDAA